MTLSKHHRCNSKENIHESFIILVEDRWKTRWITKIVNEMDKNKRESWQRSCAHVWLLNRMVRKGLTVKAAFEQLKGEVMNPSRHLQKECSRQYGQSIWCQGCLTWAIRSVWLSLLGRQSKKPRDGNPLAVQWLRLRVSTAGVPQVGALVKELRSCMPKWGA